MYNERTWLNDQTSYASSSIICFNGNLPHKDKLIETTFVRISDCNNTIVLYQNEGDTKEEFINKISVLRNELNEFINYLENNK